MNKPVLAVALTTCVVFASNLKTFGQSTALPGSVVAPLLSFVSDSTGGLHPLNGIPGAASIGPALNLSLHIRQAVTSPRNDYVLANADSGVFLIQVQGNAVSSQELDSLLGASTTNNVAACYAVPGMPLGNRKLSTCTESTLSNSVTSIRAMALSSAGTAAAVYSEPEGRIYSLISLSQSPALAATFDTSLLGSISAFAISDDGKSVVVASSATGAGSVFRISTNSAPQLVGTVQHASAIRFLSNSTDAIVADDAENTIYRLSGVQLFPIATAKDGIASPIAVALSNDNQTLFVGSAQAGSVTTLLLSGGPTESTFCHCTLTGLYATNTDSVFRISDYSGTPLLLFDNSGMSPRIVFAPTAPQF